MAKVKEIATTIELLQQREDATQARNADLKADKKHMVQEIDELRRKLEDKEAEQVKEFAAGPRPNPLEADIGFEQTGFFRNGGWGREAFGSISAPSVRQLFFFGLPASLSGRRHRL